MLRIGEFGALTGISIHMLRNYDKIGLLKPELTDRTNGYRYYSERQLVFANQLQVLKGLGFGLQEIAALHNRYESNKDVIDYVEQKRDEKLEELSKLQDQITRMDQAIRDLKKQDAYALSVVIKKIPARMVASCRGILHRFSDEGLLWEELTIACRQMGVRFADVDYAFSITHSFAHENSKIDTEVQRVVERLYPDTDQVRFFKVNECIAATVAFEGVYNQISDVMLYMEDWLIENHYRCTEKPFSTYYISPDNETNPEKFITEICFPIEKI
jgi:DNA-binding transcriptional MerR regulator